MPGTSIKASASSDNTARRSAADRAAQREELRTALSSLGYGNDEVRQVLARLPVEGSVEEMLRFALRELAGSR